MYTPSLEERKHRCGRRGLARHACLGGGICHLVPRVRVEPPASNCTDRKYKRQLSTSSDLPQGIRTFHPQCTPKRHERHCDSSGAMCFPLAAVATDRNPEIQARVECGSTMRCAQTMLKTMLKTNGRSAFGDIWPVRLSHSHLLLRPPLAPCAVRRQRDRDRREKTGTTGGSPLPCMTPTQAASPAQSMACTGNTRTEGKRPMCDRNCHLWYESMWAQNAQPTHSQLAAGRTYFARRRRCHRASYRLPAAPSNDWCLPVAAVGSRRVFGASRAEGAFRLLFRLTTIGGY